MDLLRNLYQEHEEVHLMEALEEAFIGASKSGKISGAFKTAKDFFTKHPGLTIAAAVTAVDTYAKYKQSQRNTIKLFARDPYEKKMMTDIVDSLTKQGSFKVVKIAHTDGGKAWVLKRAWS